MTFTTGLFLFLLGVVVITLIVCIILLIFGDIWE